MPQFRAFLEYNVARNTVQDKVSVRPRVVVDAGGGGGKTYTVVVPNRGIWGTAGIGGANIDPAIDNQGALEKVRLCLFGWLCAVCVLCASGFLCFGSELPPNTQSPSKPHKIKIKNQN